MSAHFALLEIVTITQTRYGEQGELGVIVEIRHYLDDRYKYELRPHLDNDVGGIYAEADLDRTGMSVTVDSLRIPGAFQRRDVVLVTDDAPMGQARRAGFVSHRTESDDDGEEFYYVTILESGMGEIVPGSRLQRTGERLPLDAPGGIGLSKTVDKDGNVVNSESYHIRDSIDYYI